jgi:flagellar hook-associated protein 3 FlgL
MKTTFVSTIALTESTRLTLLKAQAKLAGAQKEMTTGRYGDVGLSIGFRSSETVSLRQDHARLSTIKDSNALVATRLSSTQAVLQSISDDAEAFLGAVNASRESETGPSVIQVEAKTRLEALINGINTEIGGAYIFAGIDVGSEPMAQYFANPPSAGRQAVATAFFDTFGITQSDPAVANISATDMKAFLDGPFADLTADPGWSTNWATASDQNISSRISTNEMIESSTNANIQPLRDLVRAYTMMSDLGVDKLDDEAFRVVIDEAAKLINGAGAKLTQVRANLGTAQERVTTATERISIQVDIFSKHITNLEGVDPYEASARVTALMTQIEVSYALTARMQNMSLLNHL